MNCKLCDRTMILLDDQPFGQTHFCEYCQSWVDVPFDFEAENKGRRKGDKKEEKDG